MFPSILNTFNRPTATDRLNSPSHSALHNTVSSALGQVEAFIGKAGNGSTVGTLLYDVRSPDSNGGGHVQTANKGGTGQTSYTKGDFLVATSSSVLAKLAVGADGENLIADSSQSAGVRWGAGNFVGTGTDGDATISSMTTLSRDMYYRNLTINHSILTAGYRLFVSSVLSGTGGTLTWGTPNNGANSSGGTGGAGGTASTTGGWFINTAGGAGGNHDQGGTNGGAGNAGSVAGTGGAGVAHGGGSGSVLTRTTSNLIGVSAFVTTFGANLSSGSVLAFSNFKTAGGGGGGGG